MKKIKIIGYRSLMGLFLGLLLANVSHGRPHSKCHRNGQAQLSWKNFSGWGAWKKIHSSVKSKEDAENILKTAEHLPYSMLQVHIVNYCRAYIAKSEEMTRPTDSVSADDNSPSDDARTHPVPLKNPYEPQF
jgi:hypothetical protein